MPSPSWAGWGLMPYMSSFLATSSSWMSACAGDMPLRRRLLTIRVPFLTVRVPIFPRESPVSLVKLDDLVVQVFLVRDVLLHLQMVAVQFLVVVPYLCCNTHASPHPPGCQERSFLDFHASLNHDPNLHCRI